ncbi:MAG TPA: VWA domain-containing protein [Thermoanaerobaculia bacterium]|nr:VWA domain-containing protein [Thermoanaerobaculia bacterium]
MSARILGWLGALALGALALSAQELPPALPSSTFGGSVDVRVVNVEAVVTDAKGERVRGLSAGDFVLEVDGQAVPIEYFSEMEGSRAASPPPAPVAADAAPPSQAVVGRSLLVFIDDLFSTAKQRDRMLEALERDLKLLQPEDRMAIAAFFGGRVDVLCGWTGDRAVLAAALQAARKRPAAGNKALAERREKIEDDALVREALAASDPDGGGDASSFSGAPGLTDVLSVRMDDGMPALTSRLNKLSRAAIAAMNALTPPAGRRTLLVFSGGWPSAGFPIPLALAASRLGYTVYPVDLQGVDTTLAVNDASFAQSQTDGSISSPWQRESQYGMELLARITGGKAILNTAGLTALGRVMEDTSSYYSLGFAPKGKADDRYHPVRVKVRRQGLKVRSQRGFADLSHATQATMAAQGILLVGGDARTKRLVIETAPRSRQGKTFEVAVTVAIPLADLTPIEQDGKWKVEATLSTGAMDKTGSFSDLTEIPLHLTLPQKPAPDAVARYHTKMKLRRIQQRLVVTVRDPLGGAAVWGETEIKP